MGARRYHRLITRIGLDVLLLLSVVYAPWWASVLFALCILAYMNAPEVIVAGVLLDSLYGTPLPLFGMIDVLFTAGLSLAVIIAWYIKQHLLAYEQTAP